VSRQSSPRGRAQTAPVNRPSRAKSRQFDVVAILQEIQDAFVAVSFDANVQKVVAWRALCRIHTEGVFGVYPYQNVHDQFGLPTLEVRVQQNLEVVEQIDISPAVQY